MLLLIFLLALGLRLFWIRSVKALPSSDFLCYDVAAQEILKGKMYWAHEKIWPVGYPAFLAFLYYLFGHSLMSVKFVQVILSSFTAVLIYFLGKELFEREKSALLGSLIFAIYPQSIFYCGLLASETLFIFLMICSILLAVLGATRHRWIFLVFSGLLLGLSSLVRPVLLGYPFLHFLWVFLMEKNPSL